MRKIVLSLISSFLLASAGAAFSQSLADLAKKEKERREQIKAQERVVTNQDPTKFKSGSVMTVAQAEPAPAKSAGEKAEKEGAAKPDGKAASKPDKPAFSEPLDLKGRPESFWRQSLANARKKIQDLENEGNAITEKLADLRNQLTLESDGFKQQQLQRELTRANFQQNLNKIRQNAAREELDELLADARKSGALPGWLDEQPVRP